MEEEDDMEVIGVPMEDVEVVEVQMDEVLAELEFVDMLDELQPAEVDEEVSVPIEQPRGPAPVIDRPAGVTHTTFPASVWPWVTSLHAVITVKWPL
ncbi:hypothetical protein QTP88_021113 [Uroleucon formosanum]